jgi:adenine-specific DNA methylase
MPQALPKRLIEVDLPIKRISEHARREKSIRHGHISTLHIWWARRPLAACRAVICAALWPDPVDDHCPPAFRAVAAKALIAFAQKARSEREVMQLTQATATRWGRTNEHTLKSDNPGSWGDMRYALLDFIADFANWDASTVPAFLETARLLTHAAHAALTHPEFSVKPDESLEAIGEKLEAYPRPLLVDPFAGGGAIPLEALRVGADAFASDLNPVAVLLNKVVLEYIPKYGQKLADEVRKWGAWIKEQAEKELAEFYPKDEDGATPIAYLWARTVVCEGPGCGAEIPLIHSCWLAKNNRRSIGIQLIPDKINKKTTFEIIEKFGQEWVSANDSSKKYVEPRFDGTVHRGSATCPVCGFTTPVTSVRRQLKLRQGGAKDARLYCVVTLRQDEGTRSFRLPNDRDLIAVREAEKKVDFSLVPNEPLDIRGIRHTWAMIYGMENWADFFTYRQLLSLTSFGKIIRKVINLLNEQEKNDSNFNQAILTVLSLGVSRLSDICCSLCVWENTKTQVRNVFRRQAIPMIWDFAEPFIFADAAGNFEVTLRTMIEVLERLSGNWQSNGEAYKATATNQLLPDDSANAVITDPPYFDAVPYSYLSDFFYSWLKKNLESIHPHLFERASVPKDEEIIVDRPHELSNSNKNIEFYECELTKAFAEGQRVLARNGIGTIVFASKTTASWEAILQAVINAGWTITGSWPIDTEMETRVAAQGQARLGSSIHIVCRPRVDNGENVGDWRDVLRELPIRIKEWLPRLASEGVVGADAIFACLGPALEIFSRYRRVEKASGEVVTLRSYLEHVWAAVSKEALGLVFEGADTSAFEEDARLTAMWLWTLGANRPESASNGDAEADDADEDDDSSSKKKKVGGFALEFDAARKIAQGLGAHLEHLTTLVEVKGETARLLPVSERTKHLFGKDEAESPRQARKKKSPQQSLFEMLGAKEIQAGGWGEKNAPPPGNSVLDRIHQAMILFAAGRGDALRRFLTDDGVGSDQRFWQLAQALSALYPSSTEEKRWVDGLLARKKGLGF